MTRLKLARVLVATSSAAALLGPGIAYAESAPSPSTVSEVVVTATKLGATLLSRTAISANVVSGAELEQRQITTPEDLMHATSGVYIDQGSSTPKVAIRGVSFDNFQVQAENGVTTYVDGIVVLRPQAQLAGFNDLDRVEVLKGPQGSAFGRNSTGGTINYITHKPEPGYHGSISAGVGSFDRRAWGLMQNYGTDTFGIRASVYEDKDNGYVTNLVTGSKDLNRRDTFGARVALKWSPTQDLTLNYFFNMVDYEGGGPATGYVTQADATFQAGLIAFNGLTLSNPSAPATLAVNRNYDVVNSFDSHTAYTAKLQGLTIAYNLGPVTFTSVTGYLDFDESWKSDVAAPSNTIDGLVRVPYFRPKSDQFSQEFLLNGKADELKWVTGAYYLREHVTDHSFFDFNLPGCDPLNAPTAPDRCNVTLNNGQNLQSYAVFADGQYSLTHRLRLNAGIRWTHDQKKATGGTGVFHVASFGGISFPNVPLDGVEKIDKAFTGQAGLEYDLDDTTFSYIKYSRGYKAGGINNNDGTTYAPEFIDAVEVGLKGSLLDRSVHYSVSGFYNIYKNIQSFVSPPGNPVPTIVNAARAKIYGVDFDADWRPTPILSFDAAISWLPKAAYSQFIAIDPVAGLTDFKGARLSRAPRLSGVVGVNLDLPVTSQWRLRARLENYHTSSIVFSQFALLRPAGLTQKSYDLVNANVTLTYNDRVDLRFFAKNLTDQFYVTGMVESVGSHFGELGRPREFGAEVKYHW